MKQGPSERGRKVRRSKKILNEGLRSESFGGIFTQVVETGREACWGWEYGGKVFCSVAAGREHVQRTDPGKGIKTSYLIGGPQNCEPEKEIAHFSSLKKFLWRAGCLREMLPREKDVSIGLT